jgi:uncharacterized protein YjlB
MTGSPPMPPAEAFTFADDGRIPNSRLPLLVYRGVVPAGTADAAAFFEDLFARNGWGGGWRDGIFPFHHFHSTSHEVLGIARGWAEVRFGGERGRTLRVVAGDAVLIPAGVGHRRESASADLLVVGAYPDGRSWDLCRGEAGEHDKALAAIARVPLPARDPVTGGPAWPTFRSGSP